MAKKEKDFKRKSIVRKITIRENIALLWIFENKEEYLQTGKVNFNFDDYDDAELAKKDKFYFRVTDEEKIIMDDYLARFVQGVSLGAYLGTLKKKGSRYGNSSSAPSSLPMCTGERDKKCVNAPVLSSEDRIKEAQKDRVPKNIAGDFSEYPFIIDPNEDITPDNIDLPLLLRMVEENKINNKELQSLMGLKYNKFFSWSPSFFEGVSEKYLAEQDVAGCLLAAKEQQRKLEYEEPEPSEEETLARYADYLKLNIELSDETKEKISFMDRISKINDDTICFETDDGDFKEHVDIVYDDPSIMNLELVVLGSKFNFDADESFKVFGKKTSINKIIKQIYKKYPNGFDGVSFFKSKKEAMKAGVL